MTDAENAERQAKLERDFYRKHRAVIIRLDDSGVPKGLRMMIEAIAKQRFGG